jgi:tetratricopeptide (TPR) repeat protein
MNNTQLKKAINYHKKNQFKKAIKIYRELVNRNNDGEVLFLLGTAYIQNSEFENAVKYLKKLIQISPNNYHAFANLAQALVKLNLFDEAIRSFNQSISINPKFSHNFNNLGNLYFSIKNYELALINLNKAINLDNIPDFYFNRSRVYNKVGMAHEALADLNIFLTHNPQLQIAQLLKIEVLINLQKYNECTNYIKNLNLDDDTINEKYAELLLASGDLVASYKYIKKIKVEDNKNFLLSSYFYEQGSLDEALDALNKIPGKNNTQNILNNYGLIYRDLGDDEKAMNYFENVLNLNPYHNLAKLNIGLIQLKNYDFENGWKNYYFRCKRKFHCLNNTSEWNKEYLPTENTIVLSEQGVGDQILFLKVLSYLKMNNFTFTVDKRLLSNYQDSYPNFKFISVDEINKFSFKHYIYLGDFAKYFIRSKDDFSHADVSFKNITRFNFKKDPRSFRKIGISWKNPNAKSSSQSRALNLLDFMTPIKSVSANFYSLQYGVVEEDIIGVKEKLNISIIRPDFDYFNELSKLISLIQAMDFIITTDNITAHLAGACGMKTFLLIPEKRSRIWFWHNESTSSWYPNTKVYFFNERNLNEMLIKISSEIN